MPTDTALTDAKCRAAEPRDKLWKLTDGNGLYLAILPSGVKSWRLGFRHQGRPLTMTFGLYPRVSLAEARRQSNAVRMQIRAGINPMSKPVAPAPSPSVPTLREVWTAYWRTRGDLSTSYVIEAQHALERYLGPSLGDKPVNAVLRADLLAELVALNKRKIYDVPRKLRSWLNRVFVYAIEHELTSSNPAATINVETALMRRPVTSFPSLELHDMPAFIARLNVEREDLRSVLALRFLALTWTRTSEMRQAQWSQIDGDVWRVPRSSMKGKLDHLVPLSPQAIAILRQARNMSGASAYVFPAFHTDRQPISVNTVLALIARIGYRGRMTGHGLRSVGSTWANEAGWPPDAIERQLAHVERDRVRAAYNRAEYLPTRRAMLVAFADWLDACGRGVSRIVPAPFANIIAAGHRDANGIGRETQATDLKA